MKGAGDHDCDLPGCLANVTFLSPSSVLRANWTPSWRRRRYPVTFSTRGLRKSQFRGRTPNAMVQKKAPGRNPSRSGLSAGGEVRIPITSAMHVRWQAKAPNAAYFVMQRRCAAATHAISLLASAWGNYLGGARRLFDNFAGGAIGGACIERCGEAYVPVRRRIPARSESLAE